MEKLLGNMWLMLCICAPLAINGKVKRYFADDLITRWNYVTYHGGLRHALDLCYVLEDIRFCGLYVYLRDTWALASRLLLGA